MSMKPLLITQSPILNQIRNSELSKRGQTTLTGIFEGRPQNSIVRSRDFQVPRQDVQGLRVDSSTVVNRAGHLTYLDTLKPYINTNTLNTATTQPGTAATGG